MDVIKPDDAHIDVMVKSEIQNVILNCLVWTASGETTVAELRNKAATTTNVIWEVVHKAQANAAAIA